jgi:glutathione S-transferase
MADYDFYYWPLPFRGQFIRAILAYGGKTWTEHNSAAIGKLMEKEPQEQQVPFMGPPVLIDRATGFALSEMPAIALYLGETLGLLPSSAEGRAMTAKVVNDANDVIDEITLDGGRAMWTPETWQDFVPRLERWMGFWEATGSANGLTTEEGFLLGTDEAGVADIVTAVLWTTMADRFATIAARLEDTAPRTAGLAKRMHEVPALAALKAKAFADYGDGYCSGEIEKSLRAVAK